MRRYHSVQRAHFANLDDAIPFAFSELDELQIKVNVGNQLIALDGLPTIQARGREMIEVAKARVFELINAAYMDGTHDDFLDLKRTENETRY